MSTTHIPRGALVLLVGGTGAGKSSYMHRLLDAGLPPTTAVSSDRIREELFDSEDEIARDAVFPFLHEKVRIRLSAGNTTVVDATNLLTRDRAPLLDVARQLDAPTVAVRFEVPLDVVLARNAARARPRPDTVCLKFVARMEGQGSRRVLSSEVDLVVEHDDDVVFAPWGPDASWLRGPIAVIGDVHGNRRGLEQLLRRLEGLPKVYVGDLNDRGPDTPGCYELALDELEAGRSLLVASNHGVKLGKKTKRMLDEGTAPRDLAAQLRTQVANSNGQPANRMLVDTLEQFSVRSDGDELLRRALAAERSAPHQLLLDEGRTLVVHGGVRPDLVGRRTKEAVNVALYGTPTGKDPDTGFPAGRDSWVDGYVEARRHQPDLPFVVYGHIAYDTPRRTAATLGIDTGSGKDPDAPVTAAVVDGGIVTAVVSSHD